VRTLLIAVVAFILLCDLATAQKVISPAPNASAPTPLQIPSPSAANPNDPAQAKPSGAEKSAEPDQRGTQESPLIVKIFPTPKTEAETRQTQEERENKSTADWWMVRFTAILGFIGFLQLLAFGWQGWQLRRGVTVAGQAANEARDAIKATQASADAANTHARAAEEANRINRELLIATNRPWVVVQATIPEGAPVVVTADQIGARIRVRAKNIGRSPAADIHCSVELYPDVVAANQKLESITLADIARSLPRFGRMLIPEEEFCQTQTVHTALDEFKEMIRQRAGVEIGKGEPFDQGCPGVLAMVSYTIPGDRMPRYTAIVRRIQNAQPGQIGFNGTQGEFFNVAIVESSFGGARVI
jgi:hypothetical protein